MRNELVTFCPLFLFGTITAALIHAVFTTLVAVSIVVAMD